MWRRDDRSRSDRARPKAVLRVGAGGGRPLPQRGSGGVTPRKFFGFHCVADEFWCIYKTENVFLLNNFDVSKNQIHIIVHNPTIRRHAR